MFLNAPFQFRILINTNRTYFEATRFIFLDDFRFIDFYLFNVKRRLQNINIMPNIVFEICVFLGSFPKSKHVILLYVPDIAFVYGLKTECFVCSFFIHIVMFFCSLLKQNSSLSDNTPNFFLNSKSASKSKFPVIHCASEVLSSTTVAPFASIIFEPPT